MCVATKENIMSDLRFQGIYKIKHHKEVNVYYSKMKVITVFFESN